MIEASGERYTSTTEDHMDAGVAAILGALLGAVVTQTMTLLTEGTKQAREDRRHFFDARREAYGTFIHAAYECVRTAGWLFEDFHNLVERALDNDAESNHSEGTSSPNKTFDLREVFVTLPVDSEEFQNEVQNFIDSFKRIEQAIVHVQLLGSAPIQDVVAQFEENLGYAFEAVVRLDFTGGVLARGFEEAEDIWEPIADIDWRMHSQRLERDLMTLRGMARQDLGVAMNRPWGFQRHRWRKRGYR